MADSLSTLLGLGAIVGIGYYLYSTGALSNIIPGLPTSTGPFMGDTAMDEEAIIAAMKAGGKGKRGGKDDDDDDDDDKKGGRRRGDGDRDRDSYQGPPPNYAPQQPPPLPQYPRNLPAPGMISSIYSLDIPNEPPYTSIPVNTYSQYSPYNQFSSYQQYKSAPWGVSQTAPDDNVTFNDIDTAKFGCASCKHACQRNPYGFSCASCRPACKIVTNRFVPPQTGWTIAPANPIVPNTGVYAPQYAYRQPTPPQFGYPYGYSSQSFLGQVWDTLTGKGATFAEMDDYNQKRRFDCHNKLKRKVRGKDNSFVSQEDYYYDRNDIQIANA
jgi:hypothetical protein